MKQTTDHDEDKFKKPDDCYDLGWLSKRQTTDINERWPLEHDVGYENVCLTMKQTNRLVGCISRKRKK